MFPKTNNLRLNRTYLKQHHSLLLRQCITHAGLLHTPVHCTQTHLDAGGGGGGGGFSNVIRLEDIINIQIITALIAGELLHFCWYSDFFPWGTWHTRSFTSAIAPDLAIAILIGLITRYVCTPTSVSLGVGLSLSGKSRGCESRC